MRLRAPSLTVLTTLLALAPAVVSAPPAAASLGEASLSARAVPAPPAQVFDPFPASVPYGYPTGFSASMTDMSTSCNQFGDCDPPSGRIDFREDVPNAPLLVSMPLAPSSDDTSFACRAGHPCAPSDLVVRHGGLDAGVRTVRAFYVPGPPTDFDATSVTFTINIAKANTSVATSAPSPSIGGQSVALTATVNPTTAIDYTNGAKRPSGTVQFKEGNAVLATATVVDGVASATVTGLAIGGHSIHSVYSGDTNYFADTGTAINHTVAQGQSSTALVASPTSAVFSQPVSITGTVSAVAPATGTPSGTLTFFDADAAIGSQPLTGGQAGIVNSSLTVGTHVISASYGGGGPFAGSASNVVQVIVSKASTSTALTSSPNPSTLGQTVTVRATVSATAPATGTPTGTVQFFDGAAALGAPVAPAAGIATLTTSTLGGGAHSLRAVYSGNAGFTGSTSNTVNHVVTCDRTITGSYGGNVDASPGTTTCIGNATIAGHVRVPAGARVSIMTSTVNGYLTSYGGAGTMFVCGSSLGGVQVSGTAGAFTFGHPAQGCAGNRVGASFQLSNATALSVIGANTITAHLMCTDNNPDPVNGGSTNTVGGVRQGECGAATF